MWEAMQELVLETNPQFDRAVKFFPTKSWLYVHLECEPTNLLLLFFNSNLLNVAVNLNLIIIARWDLKAVRVNFYARIFLPFSKVYIDTERVLKCL